MASAGGHFGWSDYLDIFAKALRDLAAVREDPNLDNLFNFLCTVNHVSDWIRNDARASPALQSAVDDLKQSVKGSITGNAFTPPTGTHGSVHPECLAVERGQLDPSGRCPVGLMAG